MANPIHGKGYEDIELSKVKEKQVEAEHLKAKKVSWEFESKSYPSKYALFHFPQHLKKAKLESWFSNLLDMFKQLHVNIPLIEALEQMPDYVKFLKDILSKKRK